MKRLRASCRCWCWSRSASPCSPSGALDRFDPHHIVQQEEALRADIAAYPWLSAFAQVGVMTLAVATGIPGAVVVVLAGGMLFGTVTGTLLSAIGKHARRNDPVPRQPLRVRARQWRAAGPGRAGLRAGYHAYPISFAMFMRLVPFFPFGGVTVALAWLRCPLWLFLTATVLGGTVMIAFETALGAGLTETIAREGQVSLNLFTHRRVLLPVLGMAVLALAPIVLSQLRRLGSQKRSLSASARGVASSH